MTKSVQGGGGEGGRDLNADALATLGMTPEESLAEYEARARVTGRNLDRRVCICGHSIRRHHIGQGYTKCIPAKMSCPCSTMVPVVETSDTRCFMWLTTGYGREHALVKGIHSVGAKGKTWDWVEENRRCFKCETRGVVLMPCPVNVNWQVARSPQKVNALLCEDCIREVGVVG